MNISCVLLFFRYQKDINGNFEHNQSKNDIEVIQRERDSYTSNQNMIALFRGVII